MVNGTVKNLTVEGTVTGFAVVGGIAGRIENTRIENCVSNVTVTASTGAGGIAGYALGNIEIFQCVNLGDITVTASNSSGFAGGISGYCSDIQVVQCLNRGNISGNSGIGGVIGYITGGGSIEDCYNTAEVAATDVAGGILGSGYNPVSVRTCYSTGMVSGYRVGGITGSHAREGSVENSVAINSYIETTLARMANRIAPSPGVQNNLALDTMVVTENGVPVIVTSDLNGPHGQSTSLADLQQQETYEDLGWDFDTVWAMGENLLPKLRFDADGSGSVPVTSVTITPTTLALTAGETSTLAATVLPADVTNPAITWASSDTDVATVDADGVVTAVAEGTATITATADGVSGTCVVTVAPERTLLTATINDNDVRVTYSGTWAYHPNDNTFYQDDEHYSGEADAYAELTFTGVAVRLIAATSTNLGIFDVYLDGELAAEKCGCLFRVS